MDVIVPYTAVHYTGYLTTGELKVYDPTTEHSVKLEDKLQNLEALREAAQDPAIPTLTVKLQPGQLCVMGNPLPHEVLPITKVVRISVMMVSG
jgi:hypothetical protein